ncbi:hypothetical protein P59_254 [Bacillus phage P59]|nr:hypothetical protein P59_025 [Bacillus phage P59]QIW88851.1 hypothetical protein P59_254 [Bacillus phage P59]
MLGYKERAIALGKSEVYFNLHKHVFSMVQDGLVVLHSESVVLTEATFKVSEAGRQRVLREGRKNVHAKVHGNFQGTWDGDIPEGFRRAHYNPYDFDSFVDRETLEPLTEAAEVILQDKKIWYR